MGKLGHRSLASACRKAEVELDAFPVFSTVLQPISKIHNMIHCYKEIKTFIFLLTLHLNIFKYANIQITKDSGKNNLGDRFPIFICL